MSVNKVILLGNLGSDPTVRYTAGGDAVTTIDMATSNRWRDRNTGETKEDIEWHRVIFFKRLAEVAGEYLRKGSQIYVEGSIRTNRFTDRDGIERFNKEVIARELQMLGNAGGNQGGNQQQGSQASAPQQNQGQQKSQGSGQDDGMPDFDTYDDIPF